ncbi:MAG: hypothetical protein ACK47Z_20965, partial [Paracoccaceae bacterium]
DSVDLENALREIEANDHSGHIQPLLLPGEPLKPDSTVGVGVSTSSNQPPPVLLHMRSGPEGGVKGRPP